MTDLLLSLRENLQQTGMGLKSIQIIPDKLTISDLAGFPFVALMDGGEEYQDFPSFRHEKLTVNIGVYQQVLTSHAEGSMVGAGAQSGVLELTAKVVAYLADRSRLPAGFFDVSGDRRGAVETIQNKDSGRLACYVITPLVFERQIQTI